MRELVEILIPIAFFSAVAVVICFITVYNYRTKKEILEKGGNIELPRKRFPLLEIGLAILGIGLGLVASSIVKASNLPAESKDLLIGACILLFGGGGLISAFFIRRNLDEKK